MAQGTMVLVGTRKGAFVIEGDESAKPFVEAFARLFSSRIHRLQTGTKATYHAAAVFASNYLIVVLEAARQLLERCGVDDPSLFEPLVSQTFSNVRDHGGLGAMTGPLARGDVETIQRHLAALEELAPHLRSFYSELARAALSLHLVDLSADRRAVLDPLLEKKIAPQP